MTPRIKPSDFGFDPRKMRQPRGSKGARSAGQLTLMDSPKGATPTSATACVPTAHQVRIFDWVALGKGSAVVTAVAGSGKTTTIIMALQHIPPGASALLLAFNTAIAQELQRRVPKMVQAKTFHSVGARTLYQRLGKGVELDSNKVRMLCQQTMSKEDYDVYHPAVRRLVGLAKAEGIGVLVPNQAEAWQRLVDRHQIYSDGGEEDELLKWSREMLDASNEAARTRKLIDFDDQLYLPLLYQLTFPTFDWVFVDEAQDTNPVRRAFIWGCLAPGGRLVAVGDPKQAIYGFTGASPDAMDQLRQEFHCVELPLTVSFRCPQSVVRLAKQIVPYMEADPGAPEGEVLRWEDSEDQNQIIEALTPADVILCRNTLPLVTTAYAILGRGVGCTIAGRDIGQGLINLAEQMKAHDIPTLERRLAFYRERESLKLMAKFQEEKAEALRDRVDSLLCIIEHLPETRRTVAALREYIKGMFDEREGVLTLSTVHKAKGREWPTVLIIRHDLMPASWARQEWQQVQEQNLMYVAYTRAKARLIIAED